LSVFCGAIEIVTLKIIRDHAHAKIVEE